MMLLVFWAKAREEKEKSVEKSLEKVLSVLLSKGMIISATYIVAAFILVVVLNHLSKKYR